MKSIAFFTILITTSFAVINREWFFCDVSSGIPVRCGPNGNGLECASDNNKDCKWGTYGTPASSWDKMGGVSASAPLLADCPGWSANSCDVLGCDDEYRFYYLASAEGTPVRCHPTIPDTLQCASDDNINCKWGVYPTQVEYDPMFNVVSKSPVNVACPGWATKDGKDMCNELKCYSTTQPPAGSRDCSVLAIDEFLLQCSSEFTAQNTALTDLEAAITKAETDLQASIDENTGDIAQLQTDLQNGNTGTATQISSLQGSIIDVNARIDSFAAESVAAMIDDSHSNNSNNLSLSGFTFRDLFIILLLAINLVAMCYIHFYKKRTNKHIQFKQVPVQYDENDVEVK